MKFLRGVLVIVVCSFNFGLHAQSNASVFDKLAGKIITELNNNNELKDLDVRKSYRISITHLIANAEIKIVSTQLDTNVKKDMIIQSIREELKKSFGNTSVKLEHINGDASMDTISKGTMYFNIEGNMIDVQCLIDIEFSGFKTQITTSREKMSIDDFSRNQLIKMGLVFNDHSDGVKNFFTEDIVTETCYLGDVYFLKTINNITDTLGKNFASKNNTDSKFTFRVVFKNKCKIDNLHYLILYHNGGKSWDVKNDNNSSKLEVNEGLSATNLYTFSLDKSHIEEGKYAICFFDSSPTYSKEDNDFQEFLKINASKMFQKNVFSISFTQ